MCLGALVDLGCPLEHVRAELAKLRMADEYEIRAEQKYVSGVRGTLVTVETSRAPEGGRNLHEILAMIEEAGLAGPVAARAEEVFRRIGEAEAAVHGVPVEEIHFHEIGAVDSIVDIVGTCVAVSWFETEGLYASSMRTGTGFVGAMHGKLPVPAPAVMLLARGRTLEYVGVDGELTTPTGAAILAALTEERRTLSLMVEAVGYGYGTRQVGELPNVLRVVRGRIDNEEEEGTG
jgi:uncharacterized protein (TIGR00299 family) protein